MHFQVPHNNVQTQQPKHTINQAGSEFQYNLK